jgi:hypothetical protein
MSRGSRGEAVMKGWLVRNCRTVASFRFEKTAEEDLDDCLLAAEHGAGVRGKEASVGAALLTVG